MSEDKLGSDARSFLDQALAAEPELEAGPRRKMRAELLRSVTGATVVATGVVATQTSLAASGASTSAAAIGATAATSAGATALGAATAAGGGTAVTVITKAAVGLVALGIVGGGATAAWRVQRPVSMDRSAAVHEVARPALVAPDKPAAAPSRSREEDPARDEIAAPARDEIALPSEVRPRREALAPAKVAPSAPRSVPAPPDTFPEELAILERARAALAAGDWQQALRALAETGRLASTRTFAEERDALRILALCSGKRDVEARRLITVFRSSFPRSLQMERIERACSKVVTDGEPGGHSR